MNDLNRFLKAQEDDFEIALAEIKRGSKQSHWMWYIFPQIKGLGFSSTANFYAIKTKAEAENYFEHPTLGKRLVEISNALLVVKIPSPSSRF